MGRTVFKNVIVAKVAMHATLLTVNVCVRLDMVDKDVNKVVKANLAQ